ncbi:hypothetical protein T4B_1037 [Trichinella pseudospiralis]|uniref:Uncharacterized protein n=1 Tax=Trichinella pseudospiralis TaxID=6337 RepID=A0A0V1GKQ2_TRIPS|nr:hypothetical protein T4B_1037 [Trichinella pseudospiralis]
MSILVKITFSRKFQNFLIYRFACFAKNVSPKTIQ